MEVKEVNKNEYKETFLSKWIFRIIFFALTCLFCYIIIHFEFKQLRKNDVARGTAEFLAKTVENSISSFQDSWNTLYYFYQTGDLFKIMKCPSMESSSFGKTENTLLMLYREPLEELKNSEKQLKQIENAYLKCGGKVSLNIGLKDEIYKKPKDYRNYKFIIGKEPIEMLEKYPFVKHALTWIREGEKATFVSIPEQKNTFQFKKQKIYEITIPKTDITETKNIPFYMQISKQDNKFKVNNHIVCGSVVSFIYSIYDINGKLLIQNSGIEKIKVGQGEFNDDVEQLMLQMYSGDRYKILLTKNFIKPTKFINDHIIKNNDILVIDLAISNVQKS